MRDWPKLVGEKLKDLRLSRDERRQVIAELAGHLEDLYAEHLAQGMSEQDAFRLCVSQFDQENRIARKIERAKEGIMNNRTKVLWLPGLATLVSSSVLLICLQGVPYFQPRIYWIDGGAVGFDLRWLVLLPICGAIGADLSRRAGGRRSVSLGAALFPAIVMLAAFSIFLPVGLLEGNSFLQHHLEYMAASALTWIVLPAVPLLVGALGGQMVVPQYK
ncbi:MAG TPA: permease prefix domain 1-containing protein [Terriglobales bacterium]|jgi:hypothetical protein